MKIFVCGSAGQLGRDCMQVFSADHEVRGADLPQLDIAVPASVETIIGDWPQAVVNCAAFTNVDACESARDAAWRVNADGPRCLAEHADRRGLQLVHVSTDYVFDGLLPVPRAYTEGDAPAPVSAYGTSKLEGERAVQAAGCRYAILRTAWLYGASGKNFLKTMLRLALQKGSSQISVVDDQYGSPTWSLRLAEQIREVVASRAVGVFHASAEGYCTWHELANTFLEAMGVDRRTVPCSTEEFPTAAVRPKNSILENRRLKELGLHVMRDWRSDLEEYVATYKDILIEGVSVC